MDGYLTAKCYLKLRYILCFLYSTLLSFVLYFLVLYCTLLIRKDAPSFHNHLINSVLLESRGNCATELEYNLCCAVSALQCSGRTWKKRTPQTPQSSTFFCRQIGPFFRQFWILERAKYVNTMYMSWCYHCHLSKGRKRLHLGWIFYSCCFVAI